MTFDTLDEPMSCDESSGPTDTQTLRFVRCGVCGIPVYGEPNSDEPPHGARCPVCDGQIMAATGDLLIKSCGVASEETCTRVSGEAPEGQPSPPQRSPHQGK